MTAPHDPAVEATSLETGVPSLPAAGRTPLSKWLRACEESRLGPPSVCTNATAEGDLDLFYDLDGALGGEPSPSSDERPDIWLVFNSQVAFIYLARDMGSYHRRCESPAELRATLDELADSATPSAPEAPASSGGDEAGLTFADWNARLRAARTAHEAALEAFETAAIDDPQLHELGAAYDDAEQELERVHIEHSLALGEWLVARGVSA